MSIMGFIKILLPEHKQEGNVLLEPAAPMFHLLIFENVSLKTFPEGVHFSRGSQLCPR